jgi:riboflavin synthase
MFTGIIEEIGVVGAVRRRGEGFALSVDAPAVAAGLKPGDSVSVNGACLTVIETVLGRSFCVEAVPETLEKTNLLFLSAGHRVNLERSLKLEDRLSGHLVLGHVDGVGEVTRLTRAGLGKVMRVRPPSQLLPYIALKGSVAVDGASLTVSDVTQGEFEISLIPFTLENTISGGYAAGTRVNVEVDIIARYLERLLAGEAGAREKGAGKGLTMDFLKEKWSL